MLPCDPSEEYCCGEQRQRPNGKASQARTAILRDTRKLCAREHEFQIPREVILSRERVLRTREPVPRRTNRLRALSAIRSHRRILLPEIILQSMVWIQDVRIKEALINVNSANAA